MTTQIIMNMSNIVKRSIGVKLKLCGFTRAHQMPLSLLPSAAATRMRIFGKRDFNKTGTCYFHVTTPRKALPPILMLVLRFIAKGGAIISGRVIRKWWQKLSPEEKEKVLNKIRSRKTQIACAGTFVAGSLFLYYINHITEDPLTKRKRFMILNKKQVNQIAEFEFQHQLQMYKSEIVPSYHPIYRRVARVANTLILSNKDIAEIRDKVWTVTVIDRPDMVNAFALPHGKIFVFSGMLNVCTNDDQLAIVLAHEISHSVLSHVAESMSKQFFIEFILIIPTLIFWTLFPDGWALFSEWITKNLTNIFIHLPFSRAIEKEADVFGLQLAARSCYDVREAPVFWAKMKIVSTGTPIEWLSTHPRHERRQFELQELLPEALQIRESSKCPPLRVKLSYW